jgi:hypothetical protein
MLVLKSVMAGLIFAFAGGVGVLSVIVGSFLFSQRLPSGGTVGIDVGSLLKSPLLWLVMTAAFIAGFCWRYLRT